MLRLASLTNHQNAVKTIEEEFGVKWLTKKANLHKTSHPVPSQWKETRIALSEYPTKGVFEISEKKISLTSLAEDLRLARNLENYKTAIHTRLKANEFLKVWYEIYASGLCVREGFETKFIIPSQGSKTADLLLSRGSLNLHAECTQRDPYIPLKPKPEGPTKNLLSLIKEQNHAGLEIIVVILSTLEEEIIPEIINNLKHLSPNTNEYLFHGLGYGIYAPPLPPPEGDGYWMTLGNPPFASRNGIFIPGGQNPAWAAARVAKDESGKKFLEDHWRVYLHTINSHNLAKVVETFNRKRQQIPKDGPGIIFIDLAVSHVSARDIPLYLEIIAQGLSRCFGPAFNTRIWAIILTTAPVSIPTGEGINKFNTLRRLIKVLRNPYAPIPSNFTVPGEMLAS
ncbi:hypothetical protein ACTRXD_18820 [Nitrospira sp. T9]|uniref:hypothetical protein n=1 Tax=unclassified Nitrospira TaxID=2652172 RepID=UPI003F9E4A9F